MEPPHDAEEVEAHASESLERYDMTECEIKKWPERCRGRMLCVLEWIWERMGRRNLPGTQESIEGKLRKAPGKAVEFLEERAKKDGIENRLKMAQTESELQKQETEKLRQQLLREQIRETRASAAEKELDNEERRLQIISERMTGITKNRPPLQVVRRDKDTVIVLGDVLLLGH